MKLATLNQDGRDGRLVIVSRDLTRFAKPATLTLQNALDNWEAVLPSLTALYDQLNADSSFGEAFDPTACHSPLPRAYQWADGSAYLNHVELVRKARHAEVPASFYDDPLMYQGGSDSFIAPNDDILAQPEWGIDFEAEVVVVTGDVKQGTTEAEASQQIRLVMLVNDVSLRNLIPNELAKGFGFFQSKPASAFSPVAVTPDELGDAWQDSKVHLPLTVTLNDKPFGYPNAGTDMTFSFARLISHVCKTRSMSAGSIIGSGTVSNKQDNLFGSSVEHGGVGYCCLAELRMYETIETGSPQTPFMQHGDVVTIHMNDAEGQSIFGTIRNRVNTNY
ncbi:MULTISPECIES: fumarylacetoacetate hydrolase family protein [unclassified Moraxella]|uniref:fumarylacetoacetate hydrolase family protein n=1 Tax=unclassified Moraxella TaxID=2685852 RepID=UPI003AF5FECA